MLYLRKITNTNTNNMKKKYLTPGTLVSWVTLEKNFLLSGDPTVSSAEDLYYESEIDPWEDE